MAEKSAEQKPYLELRYLPTNHKKDVCALDISKFMNEIGLVEGEHYSTSPIEITDDSFKYFLNHSGGVLLQISFSNPFGFQEGILGGYGLVGDFLKRNKRRIKKGLENLK